MSDAALTNLRDYLYGTLSPANMRWLATELSEYAKKQEEQSKVTGGQARCEVLNA